MVNERFPYLFIDEYMKGGGEGEHKWFLSYLSQAIIFIPEASEIVRMSFPSLMNEVIRGA